MENYFTFIPERVWQYAEHKNWKGKKEAAEYLKEHISEIETKEQYMGALELTARIIVAKQAAVTNTVLECLSRIADLNIKFSLQHLPFFMEDIINELLNLLNDTNQKTKELAYTTYLQLPKISFLNISVPIRELIRHKSKVKNDPKLITTKLNLMEVITIKYPQFEQNAKEILNWALVFMEDPSQKVRNDANELLTHLAAILGYERATQLIASNKQHLLQHFLNLLNHSSLEHSKLDHSKLDHSKLSAIDHSKPSLEHSKLQQEFYGPIEHPSKQSLSQLTDKPIYVLEEKPLTNNKLEHSKNSRRENENMNIDLSYSK